MHEEPADSPDWGVREHVLFYLPGKKFTESDLCAQLKLDAIQATYIVPYLQDIVTGGDVSRRMVLREYESVRRLNQDADAIYIASGFHTSDAHKRLKKTASYFMEFLEQMIVARVPEFEKAA